MSIRLGEDAPDFTAETTEGTIRFHEWIGDHWAILFSHPKDFTPVCTTELGYMAAQAGIRQAQHEDHRVVDRSGQRSPEVGGGYRRNAGACGQLSADRRRRTEGREAVRHDSSECERPRTAVDNATVRSVFIIGPDKKVKAMLVYPMSAGRNFDEVLRLLDALQLNAKHTVATPELEARRRCHHSDVGVGRCGEAEVSGRLPDAEAVPALRDAAALTHRAGRMPAMQDHDGRPARQR